MKMFRKLMLCVFAALMLFGCSTPGDATDDADISSSEKCKITIIIGDTEVSTQVDKNNKYSVDTIVNNDRSYINIVYYKAPNYHAYTLENPVGADKIIEGFYYDPTFTQPIPTFNNGKERIISEDTIFYANVVDAVMINFDTNGGTPMSSIKVLKNSNYDFSCSYVNKHLCVWVKGRTYSFKVLDLPENGTKMIEGWYKDSALTQRITKETPLKAENNVTVYAKWVDSCKLTIKSGNIEFNTQVEKGKKTYLHTRGGAVLIDLYVDDKYYYSEPLVEVSDPNKIIYGIYYDSAFTQPVPSDGVLISEDTTFYAKIDDAVMISLNFNCETPIQSIKVPKNQYYYLSIDYNYQICFISNKENLNSYESIYLPENGNKIFVGWYKDSELTQEIGFNSPITTDSDVTVYAKWADICTITVMLGDREFKFDVPAGEKYFFNTLDGKISVMRLMNDETDWVQVTSAEYEESLEDYNVYTDSTYESPVSFENPVLVIGDTTFYIKK